MDTLPKVLTYVFVVTAMFSVGLQTATRDLRSLLSSRRLFLRSLVANFVIVPVIGVFLIKVLPLTHEQTVAFLLLACTPGGISALQYTTKIKGAALFAGSCAFLMAFLAVFLSPALLEFAIPFDVSVAVHYGRALGFIAAALLLPLLLGMAVRGTVGGAVGKLSKICTLASAAAFVAIVLLIMSERKEAISAVGKKAELSMLLFVVLSMIAGWIMGGPARETRHVLATVTGMRNVALSLLIAMKTFPDPAVQTPLVAFSALMVTPNTIYAVIWVLRTKRAARAGSKPGPVKRDQG